jgi:hypothetical protein
VKILAFSDWRIQPLGMLTDIVMEHKPDAILYAGDDIGRFIQPTSPLLLKTSNNLLQLSYPELKFLPSEHDKLISIKAIKALQKVQIKKSDIQEKFGVTFYYLYGNDDPVLLHNGIYYTRIHNGKFSIASTGSIYSIDEDEKGRITTKSVDTLDLYLSRLEHKFLKHPEPTDDTVNTEPSGIYARMNPSIGYFEILKSGEKVTATGIACGYGFTTKLKNRPTTYTDIFLSHLPPLGTLDLSRRFGIGHIGSKELLKSIKKFKPKLVICGHSHLWGGQISYLGETAVINVSSHDNNPCCGNYALIETKDWSIQLGTKEYKNLNAIPGTRTLLGKLNKIPVSVRPGRPCKAPTELIEMLSELEKYGLDTAKVNERIMSLEWRRPLIKKPINFDPYIQSYVDVETGLFQGSEPGALWLIGLWHKGELRHFRFPDQYRDFKSYLKKQKIDTLVSWTGYDRKALEWAEVNFIDACQRVRNCVVWHTYKLHDLYDVLFPEKVSADLIPGFAAGIYADHLINPDEEYPYSLPKDCPYCPPREEIIEKIKARNAMDILQMIEICKFLYQK